jgi:hypothetical protein
MKALFRTISLIVMIVFLFIPRQSFASSDTLVVLSNISQTLDQVITADQSSSTPHSVYELTETDVSYLLDATVNIANSVTILGIPSETGQRPVVQSDVLSSGAITGIQWEFTGFQTKVVLQGLYLLGVAPNGLVNTSAGQGVQVAADSVDLIVNQCVFDDFTQFDIATNAKWDKFLITNSEFRNGVEGDGQYYIPESLRSLGVPCDTVIFNFNTFLGVAEGPVLANVFVPYFEFNHNTMVDGCKGPVWTEQMTNAVVENNIFYNQFAVSDNEGEYYGKWNYLGPGGPRVAAVFDYAPVDSQNAVYAGFTFTGPDTGAAAAAVEAPRKITVKNNVFFNSADLLTLYASINDTTAVVGTNAYADSIFVPEFMNTETAAMFANTAAYPNLVQSRNVVGADPGFGASIKAMDAGATGDGVGLLAWISAIRTSTATTQYFAYQRSSGSALPKFPTPEFTSGDLIYTATFTTTDGLKMGDPYWFTGTQTGVKTITNVPHTYSLSQNYPNPFNPSTVINFSLEKPSNVTLSIYNVLGQKVASVVNSFMQAGSYTYQFDASKLASGVYIYRIEAGTFVSAKKMILMK